MEQDGIAFPPGDWAVEPQGLGPGVMAAHTLLSDSQSHLVARVLNNSLKPITLKANSFLSTAEPVQCLSGSCFVVERLLRRLGISHLRTSAYHPETDAKCERVHFSVLCTTSSLNLLMINMIDGLTY